MATLTPDEGLEFAADKIMENSEVQDWEIFQVAVGSGTANLDNNDTQLANEEYRANKDDSVVDIADSSIDGQITVKITISGGTEVPAGTTITEFGIFGIDPSDRPTDDTTDAKDRLLHRELRAGITLESGDRKTFELPYVVDSR